MTIPFDAALALADRPAWLAETRRQSLDNFLHSDFPDSAQEEWKYTSLERLQRMVLHSPMPGAVPPRAPKYPGQVLAFRDDAPLGHGVYHGDYEYDEIVASLRRVADSDSVRHHLGSLAGDSALVNLNNALWRDGAYVLVTADSRMMEPIFISQIAAEAEAMLYPRGLIVLEAGSEAVLVEHYRGEIDAPYWRNPVSEIVIEGGARLTHIRILEEGAGATHTGLTAARLGRNSFYRVLHLGLGGALSRHDLKVELAGEGAELRVDALNLAGDDAGGGVASNRDLHLRVEHRAAYTRSCVQYRGLIDGHSRGVFDGRVVVHPAAHGADAYMLCRSLLLSPWAEADVKPQLEIHTDEVKCGHGASVGTLDDDALFYLRSRGLDATAARRLLMEAYAGEVLGLLDETGLKDWLLPSLLARLPEAVATEVKEQT
jgi:Fe-S cluster assembly protein SufD